MTLSLAPLHGVTNRVFRAAYLNHFPGFDEAFAPFVLGVPIARMKSSHLKDLAPDPDPGVQLVPQILGNDAEGFVATARAIADLGYAEVNWNLGCPYPMVAKKIRGSGLLPHPERIERLLDAAIPRLESFGLSLSVKARLGRFDRGEIIAIMPILNRYPIVRVIIHPRLGVQMYSGEVDLEGFERAAAACAHPVAYNGDIRDLEGFARLSRRFPAVDRWMIGRAAIADPFLAGRIRGLVPVADPLSSVRAFHDELLAGYRSVLCGPAHALDKMREAWSYFGPSIEGVSGELAALKRARDLDSYSRAVDAVFARGSWAR